MALIRCPDCNREVSDLAVACPNCARPIRDALPNALQSPTPSVQTPTSISSPPVPTSNTVRIIACTPEDIFREAPTRPVDDASIHVYQSQQTPPASRPTPNVRRLAAGQPQMRWGELDEPAERSAASSRTIVRPGRRAVVILVGLLSIASVVTIPKVMSSRSSYDERLPLAQAPSIPVPAATTVTRAATSTSAPAPTEVPKSPQEQLQAARSALGGGDPGRAVQLLSGLKQSAPSTPGLDDALYQAYMAQGKNLFERNMFDESDQAYQEALRLRRDDPGAREGQKQVYLAKHWAAMEKNWSSNPDAAISALEQIMRTDADYRQTREKLYALLVAKGQRLSGNNDKNGAISALNRAVEVNPNAPEARRLLSPLMPTTTPIPLPTATPVSLPNGTRLERATDPDGLGWLKIVNGIDHDAVAKLKEAAPPNRTRRSVYIRANNEFTLPKVGVGTYILQFMTGLDWDRQSGRFQREATASQFVDTFDFREIPSPGGVRYSTWEVTLNPVIGGTARANSIDPAVFAQD